jgi:serine/threonine protein kinase
MPISRADWPQLLDLIDQALDMPVAARSAWVSGLNLPGPLDTALRGLLEDRLAIETKGYLLALPPLAGLRPPWETSTGRAVTGASIGPWRLLRSLGEGGMSAVWLAERADGQGRRQVALKLPHAGPGHELLARRLLRERDILASLEHPHIARLYDVGVSDSGVPYLAMEHVEGDSLLADADARRLTLAQRLATFRQVLAAVQYAHGKLVLHRDLKPANILVDALGQVKLLDFGIAKLLAPSGAPMAASTELTWVCGRHLTPAYASPEQLRGEPLGTVSDIYSLGLVLYELLSGQRPFESPGASLAQIENAILTREPRPLGHAALGEETAGARATSLPVLRRVLGGDLNAIVLKALARAPERRYPSVEALDSDVARWLGGRPVSAHPPGRTYYFAKFVSRNRRAVGLTALAVLVLLGASGAALFQARVAGQQAARAAAVRDLLGFMFDETHASRTGGQTPTAKDLLEKGRQRALQGLAATPDVRAELLQNIGDAQANIADRTGADRTYADAIDTYARAGDERARVLALMERVDNALALGHVDDADALLKSAVAASARIANDFPVTGTLLREQAYVAAFRRDWVAARDLLQRYLALARRHPETSPVDRVQALQNLATALARSDDLPGAMARIAEAFETLRQHPEIPIEARMDVVNYRQDIDFSWGRYAAVERTSPADIRECDLRLTPHGAICLKLKLRLQLTRLRLGLTDQAEALDPELAPLLDPSSPRDQLAATSAIARTLARAGRLDSRPDILRQLQQIEGSVATSGLDANFHVVALNALAEVELLARRPERALAWIADAERLLTTGRPVVRGEIHRMQALKGLAMAQQGQHGPALQAMVSLCAEDVPNGMARVQDHLLRLNCVPSLLAGGHSDRAMLLLEQSLPVVRDGLGAESPVLRRAQAWLDAVRSSRPLPSEPSLALTLFT